MAVEQRKSTREAVEDHLQLLEVSKKIANVVSESVTLRDYCSPILLHPDLHARNIFVDPDDPTKILGIIDWQSAAV